MINQNKINMNISAIILAAGNSNRLSMGTPKQFIKINNRELIDYSIEKFKSIEEINEIIIVVPKFYYEKIKFSYPEYKIIIGGENRQESSYKGLLACNEKTDKVLIHDAARIFIKVSLIKNCIKELEKSDAVTLGIPVTDTIAKCSDNQIIKMDNRANLTSIQTPQGFNYNKIKIAHSSYKGNATDDIRIMFESGYKCKIIPGDENNFKITSPKDLSFAKFKLESIKIDSSLNSNIKKKFLFIIQYDSFLNNLLPIIDYLISEGHYCDIILYKQFLKKNWVTRKMKNELLHIKNIESGNFRFIKKKLNHNAYNVLIVGVIGTRLIQQIHGYTDKINLEKIKIASGYIGALLMNNKDAFYKGIQRRSLTDLVWTPGFESKNEILSSGFINDLSTKVIATGLPSFDKLYSKLKKINPKKNKNIVFLEQPTFPESKSERILLIKQLIKFAKKHKDKNLIIKPRFPKRTGHAHRPKYLLQDLIKSFSDIPKNLEFSYNNIYDLFTNCGMTLTISSTAGLEAMLAGIPTYFITDFCNGNNIYGSNDFKKYNACITFENLLNNKFPNIDYSQIKEAMRFDGNNTQRLANELIKLSYKN